MTRTRATAATPQRMQAAEAANPQATRETVESIVVAIILAFLFRAFVAEAFVIPTGSMAPTLQGRHLDLTCDQCGYQYRTGASLENDHQERVSETTCQVCRFPMQLARTPATSWLQNNQDSFNGDRILVSKFTYEIANPKRWDVIVFKYPGNAKQNYIKRLIGLPGETVWIQNGDIYIASPGQAEPDPAQRLFEIARKPPAKVKAMLQLVDDTDYIGSRLTKMGWPSRWSDAAGDWEVADGQRFRLTGRDSENVSWLRYRHLVPTYDDWLEMDRFNELPRTVAGRRGQLITDYYAYNNSDPRDRPSALGTCWVGDLSIDADVDVQSDTGELWLELIEGGVHFRCQIDVASGVAQLSIDDGAWTFFDAEGNETQRPSAETKVGPGRHRLQFANVDDQLLLWVDSKLVEFDGPTSYHGDDNPIPAWSETDPGDIAPLAIGSRGASLEVTRLKVLRDVYYQAVEHHTTGSEYQAVASLDELRRVFSSPEQWATHPMFRDRRGIDYPLGDDQFFPLGDNSPQSKDARLWTDANTPHYVERQLLLGKALVIYWPHAWRPFLPNFARMGLIR